MAPKLASYLTPLLILCICSSRAFAVQQEYNEQDQLGYRCSSPQAKCPAQAVYRVKQGESIQDIATQFRTTIEQIQNATNLSADASVPLLPNRLLLIPIICSCSASTNRSSALVYYVVRQTNNFWQIATETFEGLTTHQALEAANPQPAITRLLPGQKLHVPIRCACPEEDELRLLVTYVLDAEDTSVAMVSRRLGVAEADVVRANGLPGDPNMKLQQRTTLLIPLKNVSRLVLPVPVPVPVPAPADRTNCADARCTVTATRSRGSWGLAFGIACAALVLILILGTTLLLLQLMVMKKKTKRKNDAIQSNLNRASSTGIATNVIMNSDKPIWYSRQEIEQATGYFDPACHIEGAVYAGILRGSKVAIKRIHAWGASRELSILCRVHHTNLVMLVGACQEADHPSYIVYEYAENGSLARWLHRSGSGGSPLKWTTRLRIALDVATGLEYLHNYTKPGFVHKDITSSNILLDADFHAKIANFGVAKASTWSTQGYMSPEYLAADGATSSKVDVYAFGVVLLELLTGLEPTRLSTLICSVFDAGSAGNGSLNPLQNWVDPALKQDYPKDSALALALLARLCLQDDPKLRPTMRDVSYAVSKLASSPQA